MAGYALVLGEALVDLIEDEDEAGLLLRPRYGGSPLNVAVGLRRLGIGVEFAGAFGIDAFGSRLREFLSGEGVGLTQSSDTGTGSCLSLATRQRDHVHYEYVGEQATMYRIGEVDPDIAADAAVAHAGSTAINGDPGYSSVLAMYAAARGVTTLDPNPRPFLISDLDDYRTRLERAAERVDLVKLSSEDAAYLYPGEAAATVVDRLRGAGSAAVIVTRAENDTLVFRDAYSVSVPVPAVDAIDPTGAGDSFMASVLGDLLDGSAPSSAEQWVPLVRRANAAAALTCTSWGGAEAMPTRAQLDAVASSHPHLATGSSASSPASVTRDGSA